MLTMFVLLWPTTVGAQDQADTSGQDRAVTTEYVSALALLPNTTAGLLRIPNFPSFCQAIEQTHFGQLLKEESVQPFAEVQRRRFREYLESMDNKVGIRSKDLYDIAAGEVVISWLPYENDKRRPFSICVIADIRGLRDKAEESLEQIDADLKAGGWVRKDVKHLDQPIRIYSTKPKPGQLKVNQVALTVDDTRIIAADRDSVVTNLLDVIASRDASNSIGELPDFQTVISRSVEDLSAPMDEGGGTLAAEWFVRPFGMGRILRESFRAERRNQLDVLQLLQNQGFDAIRAAGGAVALAGEKFDVLQQGYVLSDLPLERAARMLDFFNQDLGNIPSWVHPEAATFNRIQIKIEEAFLASGSLIDEAFDDEIFDDIIEGIREDEDGPQIDITADVLPNLDDQVMLITDNTVPAGIESERMLVAIRVLDAEKIKIAIRKAMEVEPDATQLDILPGVEIWQVERGQGEDELEKELFGDFDIGLEEDEEDEPPPLLDQWAIALINKGKGSDAPYLMFSSHPELLVMTAKRIQSGDKDGLGSLAEIQRILDAMKELGCGEPAVHRVVRTRLSLRTKYELLRQGKLRESDSVLAQLINRLFEEQEDEDQDEFDAKQLPPLAQIEKHLPNGGTCFRTTRDGWAITGFLLK